MKTDAQLCHDVLAQLSWEPALAAAHIGVQAHEGVVTLEGQVGTCAEQWQAQCAARRVPGINALAVEMAVNPCGAGRCTDADIARSAERILAWMTCLPRQAVQVSVADGWITLSGAVDWPYQQQAAADGIRHVVGARGLRDLIVVKPLGPATSKS
jgi:osmotically-inducible protein OsmY